MDEFQKEFRRPSLTQPELDLDCGRSFGALVVVGFHKPAKHGPVLVTLGFLGLDEVRQSHDMHVSHRGNVDAPSPRPKFTERIAASHDGHHVNSQSVGPWNSGAKMTGMSLEQGFPAQRRNEHGLGAQIVKGRAKAIKVVFAWLDGQIDVAAEFRGPVHDARLTAHQ